MNGCLGAMASFFMTGDPNALKLTPDDVPGAPPLDTGESFTSAFGRPGIHRYFCSLHPHMQGTVVVR